MGSITNSRFQWFLHGWRGWEIEKWLLVIGRGAGIDPRFSNFDRRRSGESADGDERDAFVFFVASDAGGSGIEGGFAVDEELVMMMAVAEWNADVP
jgi:hypothetical protein